MYVDLHMHLHIYYYDAKNLSRINRSWAHAPSFSLMERCCRRSCLLRASCWRSLCS